MSATFKKDPDAVLDYQINWTAFLSEDEISNSSWSVPDGITMDSNSFTTSTTTIWLSGGTVGEKYALTNHIVTTSGREDDRTIKVKIKEK